MPIGVGQALGNYRVVSKLGAGGMGAVYLAEHPLIGKKVALKVIHRDLSTNREVVTRFFNEARAVNQIGNDHIVDISDFGQTPDGEYFFIMELLNGRCLGDVIEQERVIPTRRALDVAQQIADALGASHAVGIIHRDLKPDNVFLITKMGSPDFVKILDFGLAKLIDSNAQKLTKQGVILGTPQYMSPEQCESKGGIDHRTDIYALGVLLFQMVTGVLPFDGQTMGEILVKHVAQPAPSVRGVNPGVPPAVEQIILRCLAKRADDRFQTMRDLRAALLDPDGYVAHVGWGFTAQATSVMHALPSSNPASPATRHVAAPYPPGARPVMPLPAPAPSVLGAPVDRDTTARHPRRHGGRWVVATAFVVTVALLTVGGLVLARRDASSGGRRGLPFAPPATSSTALTEGAAAPAPPPAAPAPTPAPPPVVMPLAPALVKVSLTSEPSGAEVLDQDSGQPLGRTPLELSLAKDLDHRLIFRKTGYGEKRKVVRASSDTAIEMMLEAQSPATASSTDAEEAPERRRPEKRRKSKVPDL